MMRIRSLLPSLSLVLVLALNGCSGATPPGDPLRGAQLHEVCLDCHGTELYARSDRKVKSLDALRKDVVRWGDYYNPALSEQDVDDLVAYLNQEFYKF